MIVSVYIPLLLGCLLAWLGTYLGRWFAPAAATRLLTALAVLSATATTGSLLLMAVGGLLKTIAGPLAGQGGVLGVRDSVPWPVGAAAALVLAMLAVRLIRVVAFEVGILRELREAVGFTDESLLVFDDARIYAYAVPVGRGTVVVSTAMMDTLDAGERRALLAHEQAHLTHRHHLHRLAASLGTALNPLLGPLAREVKLQTERWADESAATLTTRQVTARSLARAALAAAMVPRASLAYAADSIRERLDALAAAPERNRWHTVVPAAVACAIAGGALLDAAKACCRLIEIICP
ncbi:M48 family metalloprotease [Arthrobacter sp. A5]|uniref:M48 family metalloprotease n=1 Tax=Arthrobacter sp. A5 TaxID=576926 RepID=UPI003DA91DFB